LPPGSGCTQQARRVRKLLAMFEGAILLLDRLAEKKGAKDVKLLTPKGVTRLPRCESGSSRRAARSPGNTTLATAMASSRRTSTGCRSCWNWHRRGSGVNCDEDQPCGESLPQLTPDPFQLQRNATEGVPYGYGRVLMTPTAGLLAVA
jgi:hypothetical protein